MNRLLRILLTWLVFLPLSLVFGGYLFSVLWQWFAVPIGAPLIDIPAAVGLQLLVSWFMIGLSRRKIDVGEDGFDEWAAFIYSLVMQMVFFGVGYVVHLFQVAQEIK